MKKLFFSSALLICMTLYLSSCGGSASTELTVVMTDFHFTPDNFTVSAGREFTLTLINNGAIEHEFAIFNLGADVKNGFDSENKANIYWSLRVGPDESKTVTLNAPADLGEYYIVCGIPGHFEAGMLGSLIVIK